MSVERELETRPAGVRVVHGWRVFEVATPAEALAYAAAHGWDAVTYWPLVGGEGDDEERPAAPA